ncbi:hypothetical protein B0H16DRAFT_1691464 [Mycena metata]|uniref:Uncharacterized protein n=1 Tax=Mycena metata TaxID=1033252 RepID=A0AAD7IVY3_9AGAR|nr:hypothetical protein B0H16DRAFT_1691464 [Mycena metata]
MRSGSQGSWQEVKYVPHRVWAWSTSIQNRVPVAKAPMNGCGSSTSMQSIATTEKRVIATYRIKSNKSCAASQKSGFHGQSFELGFSRTALRFKRKSSASHCVKRQRRQMLPTSDDPMPIIVDIDEGCADQRRQSVLHTIDTGRQTSAPVPTQRLNAGRSFFGVNPQDRMVLKVQEGFAEMWA